MACYEKSSQLKHWTFSNAEEILELRNQARSKSVANGLKEQKRKASGQELNEPLGLEEEVGLLNSMLKLIKLWCFDKPTVEKFNPLLLDPKLANRLYWTATTMFKRFYLKHTAMEENPTLILTVALYCAGKVEEIPLNFAFRGVRVDELAKKAKLNQRLIVDNEIRFLGGIDFEMVVFHPTRPRDGFVQKLFTEKPQHQDTWEQLEHASSSLLEKTLSTDLMFLYSPSKIAFVSLLLSYDELEGDMESSMPFSKEELAQWMLPAQLASSETAVNTLLELCQVFESAFESTKKINSLVSKKSRSDSAKRWVTYWKSEFSMGQELKGAGHKIKPDENDNPAGEFKKVEIKKEPKISSSSSSSSSSSASVKIKIKKESSASNSSSKKKRPAPPPPPLPPSPPPPKKKDKKKKKKTSQLPNAGAPQPPLPPLPPNPPPPSSSS